jgi:hypothetical protein
MATATRKAYEVVGLDGIEPGDEHDGRVRLNVRRELDVHAFGVNAFRAVGEGSVIGEHDEVGIGSSSQEELYVVLNGGATFNIDGERLEAPAGSFVFVRNPAAKRSAVAHEVGTTVLAIGGTPGEPYRVSPGEAMQAMWEPYRAGDYATALERLQEVNAERPNEALVLFNIACCEARLGRTDDAVEHLREAFAADKRVVENARTDEDLDSLREDPRFTELVR